MIVGVCSTIGQTTRVVCIMIGMMSASRVRLAPVVRMMRVMMLRCRFSEVKRVGERRRDLRKWYGEKNEVKSSLGLSHRC
jgi:nicotinamide mononucleotide adenylyltransferase